MLGLERVDVVVPLEEPVAEEQLNPQDVPQAERELTQGSRICFYFDQGKVNGTYVAPSKSKKDKGKGLHYVRWDDGDDVKVELSKARRFDKDDVSQMERGE